jgi:hypothetical protein
MFDFLEELLFGHFAANDTACCQGRPVDISPLCGACCAASGARGMMVAMRCCHKCGTELDDELEVFRATTCPKCDADLRCCLNCTFYSPGAQWDCRETIDEPVRDKDRGNFCSFFRFRQDRGSDGSGVENKARDTFDKLFGN